MRKSLKANRDECLALAMLASSLIVLVSLFVSSVFPALAFYYTVPLFLLPALFIPEVDRFLLLMCTALFTTLSYSLIMFSAFLVSIVLMLFPLWVLMRGRTAREALHILGFRGNLARSIIIAVAAAFPALVLALMLSIAASLLGADDSHLVAAKVAGLPVHILIYAVMVAPVAEEVFFRSFLPRHMHPVFANALFALAHFSYGSYFEIVGAFFLGLFLYALYRLSGDIKPAIFLHAMINMVSLYIMLFWA